MHILLILLAFITNILTVYIRYGRISPIDTIFGALFAIFIPVGSMIIDAIFTAYSFYKGSNQKTFLDIKNETIDFIKENL